MFLLGSSSLGWYFALIFAQWRSTGTGTDWSETRWVPLTNNEPLCVGELLEEFPEVLIALLVCRAQHLHGRTQSESHARQRVHAHAHTDTPVMLRVALRQSRLCLGYWVKM